MLTGRGGRRPVTDAAPGARRHRWWRGVPRGAVGRRLAYPQSLNRSAEALPTGAEYGCGTSVSGLCSALRTPRWSPRMVGAKWGNGQRMGLHRVHQPQQQTTQWPVLKLPTLVLVVLALTPLSTLGGAEPRVHDDFYARLGVLPSAGAREIKKAYRSLSLEWHPDKAAARGVDPDLAQEQFVEVARAYEILSNPELRRIYDEERQHTGRQRRPTARKSESAGPSLHRDQAAAQAARRKEWAVKLDWAARMFKELFPDTSTESSGDNTQQWVAGGVVGGPLLQGFVGMDTPDGFGISFKLDIGSPGSVSERQHRNGFAERNPPTPASLPPQPTPSSPSPSPQPDLNDLLHKEHQQMLTRKSR